MILSTDTIRELMFNGEIKIEDKLFISPILDWDQQAKPGNCSIDVRLGQRFRIPRRTKLDCLDHLSDDYSKNVEIYKDDQRVPIGDYFVLHPRQFVLGETLEWIRLPKNLAAYVIGRSSWGRDGLIIATATGIHALYSGILTLEIANLGEIPVRLYPGLTIAQLFIHTVSIIDNIKPCRSVFSGATFPENSNAAGNDRDIIRYLRQKGSF